MIKEYIIVQITNIGMRDRTNTFIPKEINMADHTVHLSEPFSEDERRGIFSDELKAMSILRRILEFKRGTEGYYSILTVYSNPRPRTELDPETRKTYSRRF